VGVLVKTSSNKLKYKYVSLTLKFIDKVEGCQIMYNWKLGQSPIKDTPK
jgi:hypothetical protein